MSPPPSFLTSRQVARRLGVTDRHVRRLVTEGKLAPGVASDLPVYLFRPEDVEALAESRRLNPPRIGRPPKRRPEALAA